LSSPTQKKTVTPKNKNVKNAKQSLSQKIKLHTDHPAQNAVSTTDQNIENFLKEKHIDVTAPDFDLTRCISAAAICEREDVIRRLLSDRGPTTTTLKAALSTALLQIARNGSPSIAQLLLNHGADVEAKRSENGDTALHQAVRNRHDAMVRLLLKAGGNGRTMNNDRIGPYQLAGKLGYESTFMIFHDSLEPQQPVHTEWVGSCRRCAKPPGKRDHNIYIREGSYDHLNPSPVVSPGPSGTTIECVHVNLHPASDPSSWEAYQIPGPAVPRDSRGMRDTFTVYRHPFHQPEGKYSWATDQTARSWLHRDPRIEREKRQVRRF
jgi:uncharacterized protein